MKEKRMNKQFNYGGQAVLEGVMMRGSRNMAVAVRAPYGYYKDALKTLKETYPSIDLEAAPVSVAEIVVAEHLPKFDEAIAKEGVVLALRLAEVSASDAAARQDVAQRLLSAGVLAAIPLSPG